MLYTETLTPDTLGLLKSLQNKEYLSGFLLVGGSALALYLGHRRSIDLDLFTHRNFEVDQLLEKLSQDFHFEIQLTDKNTLRGSIQHVNVNFIAHRYPLIGEPHHEKNIRLISEEDIIAMKLNAISVSGQRSKDFVDIYYALQHYSLDDMLGFYRKKYDQQSVSHVLKSLVYFEDLDLVDWPVLLQHAKMDWNQVKDRIEKVVFTYTDRKL